MEKGLLFLTITAGCLWIILDEFFGTQKVSGIAQRMTPNATVPFEKTGEAVKEFFEPKIGTATEEKITSDQREVKKKIDDNSSIKPDAKKILKEAVDKFYNDSNPGRVV